MLWHHASEGLLVADEIAHAQDRGAEIHLLQRHAFACISTYDLLPDG
ncbi:hypothetical protein [Dyella sp.]